MTPSLLLVAHGSADPAATAQVRAVRDRIAAARPDIACAAGFLEQAKPTALDALGVLPRPVVAVPYLLAAAFHFRVDIAALGADGIADVLGADPALVTVARDRLAGHPGAVVLASAGTSDAAANAASAGFADLLARSLGRPVRAAFATAAEPTVSQAIAAAPGPVVVVRWLLSAGRFADRIAADAAAGGAACTDVIGDHPAVAALLLTRYGAAAAALS